MNNKIKNTISFLLAFLILIVNCNFSYALESDSITAPYAIAIEASTGKILFEKNSQDKLYPASTTKVWTAYLVIKNCDNLDEVIEVKNDLSWVEPTSMFLKVGEKFTVRELLNVLMLKSANDVAILLAEHISGSVEEFAKLMNDEAKKVGCLNTNFVNPNGLPDDNHYSTAYDMAILAKEAMKSEELKSIVKTESIKLPANDIYPYERNYTNGNRLLTGGKTMMYDGEEIDIKHNAVNGLKTGYTSRAGRCLLSSATLDDTTVIVGVFKADGDNVYVDSKRIIDYSLERFKATPVVRSNEFKLETEVSPKKTMVEGYIKDDYVAIVDTEEKKKDYSYEVEIEEDLNLPLEKDAIIGEVKIKEDGKQIDTVPVLSANDVEKKFSLSPYMGLLAVIFTTFVFILVFIRKKSKENKMKNIEKRENAFNNRRR